jgi:hypothetical protein
MTEIEFQNFVDNYSKDDFEKIRFDWNGKHADEFHDNNYDFRMSLCEFLVDKLVGVKLELISDLFKELGKSSKETWSVYGKFHLFGQQILKRGTPDNVMDYLFGAVQSFDTVLSSGQLDLTTDQKKKIGEYIKTRLQTEKDEKNIRLLKFGLDRFQIKQ